MARTWLVDGVGIARKVKHASQPSACQIKDSGATRECSHCHYQIDNSDVPYEWPGLPAGVKFDPSDLELVEHLAAKCGTGNSQPHAFIDVFIPTLEGEQGICYTHPENLPGAKKDGSSVYFFHITKNAHATGNRKRRKIHYAQSSTEEQVRWHKTGKTKPVMDNGVQVGCMKIMVLYKSSTKGSKPGKANWVMRQYHLGNEDDERENELVVSKVFYKQQKPDDKNDDSLLIENPDMIVQRCSPKTPKIVTPHPPRPSTSNLDDDDNDVLHLSSTQLPPELSEVFPSAIQSGGTENSAWLAGESQAMDFQVVDDIDESLLCKEILDSYAPFDDPGPSHLPFPDPVRNSSVVTGETTASYGLADLENLDFDTPPDFQFLDLQFGSQDSIFGL